MQPEFALGQVVCLKADLRRKGPVIEVLPPMAGRIRYRVFHSPEEIREYDEEQISGVTIPPSSRSKEQAFRADRVLPAREFSARLTAIRLAHPLTDNLYALHAARIKFIPFQFKPLLRLLRSDRPRLLVADEVGVGKTIEAGLMLKELQSRQRLENILIVCPKALVIKWRDEMRRFDEDFHPLKAETLRYCLRETYNDGAWPAKYSRAIVHLELFRNPDYLFGTEGRGSRPGLGTLDPPAQFSLAIFDEAHHLRNTDTNSNQLARFICDNSEAAIFLSATPVHLGSRNLFTLLNLLRPDLFPSEAVFNEMVEPNRHLIQAIRHVRGRQPTESWAHDAVTALTAAGSTAWGARALAADPRFAENLQMLVSEKTPDDLSRIRCVRDLEELHTLAHVMNRTRRRDIGRFTLREPHTITVPFTPAQQSFYRALLEFRTRMLLLRYDPMVVRLIIDMLERQAASCLPALLPMLDVFIETGRFSSAQISDEGDEEEPDIDLPETLRQQADALRNMGRQLPTDDPKVQALLDIAQNNRSKKLLVFSFFIHTLRYLERHLRAAGFRVGLITGQTPDDLDEDRLAKSGEPTRGQLRDRFRTDSTDPDALDVLLSSEVGCEGLDYEFCDRMVNYDIPWNPMRLEQRIGRIDRFGQASEKVLIFNFVTPGTVEERIFFRCFERLGIFRDTIGDCEEVLGEQTITEQLLELARDTKLTPEQAELKARQLADNALRVVEERRRLELEGGKLLGLDQALTDEANAAQAEGRYIRSEDLQAMIRYFLSTSGNNGSLEDDPKNSGCVRLRLSRETRTTLASRLRSWRPADRSLVAFRRWLESGDPHLAITFVQAVALENRSMPFITPVHPLARLATEELKNVELPVAASLMLKAEEIPPGEYAFVCDLWETIAITPEIRMMTFVWDMKSGQEAPDVAKKLLTFLGRGQDRASIHCTPSEIDSALDSLERVIHAAHRRTLDDLASRNTRLVEHKLASLDSYHRNRIARIRADLANIQEDRIRRMKTAELSRAQAEFDARHREIESRRSSDIIRQRVAFGTLKISHE